MHGKFLKLLTCQCAVNDEERVELQKEMVKLLGYI